jgi:alpha-D-ribose 1-methylphosphonate 5-triphosphate synthase subunit PhnH
MIGTSQEAQVLYDSLTFRLLLDALARPGKINRLAYPSLYGEAPTYFSQVNNRDVAINIYALGALLVLLDRETTFVIASDGEPLPLTTSAVRWTMLRSGSNIASVDQAAFALFCARGNHGLFTQLDRGTMLEPELSATVICAVEQLDAAGEREETHDDAIVLNLQGPGIQDMCSVRVRGLVENDITALIAAQQSYPLGIDAYLIDADGRCIGLPRTTKIVRS